MAFAVSLLISGSSSLHAGFPLSTWTQQVTNTRTATTGNKEEGFISLKTKEVLMNNGGGSSFFSTTFNIEEGRHGSGVLDSMYWIMPSLLGLLKNNDRTRSARSLFLRRPRNEGII